MCISIIVVHEREKENAVIMCVFSLVLASVSVYIFVCMCMFLYVCAHCCSMQSHKYTRGKRKTFSHLLVSLSAIAQDKTKAIKTQFRNCT